MTTPAPSAGGFPRLSDTGSPAIAGSCHPASAGDCGPAQTAATKPSDVERRLSEWRRLLLIRDLSRAQAAHRATSSIRRALAAVTVECLR